MTVIRAASSALREKRDWRWDEEKHTSRDDGSGAALRASAHRTKGLMESCRERKTMLTRSATRTRDCSYSLLMSSTHPVTVSLRHISSGSHQKTLA